MSMLSAQIDRLRELATRYDELQVGAVKAVTIPSDMGSILREAADTIWQLRDDLQRANAENTKLRELLDIASDMANDYDGDRRLLRQLVRDLYAEYRFAHTRMRYVVLQHEERMRELECRMRELGVES